MNNILLRGCTSQPMVNYLKALGILRLLSEQVDPLVKGFWQDICFGLETKLDKSELLTFFCQKYIPTPLVAPWNSGSGFYPGDNTSGLDAIIKTNDYRFKQYTEVIQAIQSWPEMPKISTIKEVISTIKEAIIKTTSEKQQHELQEIISDLQKAENDLNGYDKQKSITFEELERKSKNKNIPDKQQWNKLYKAASKARTQCLNIYKATNKEHILVFCRSRLPDDIIDWLDAVYALNSQGNRYFSPILGTGANEGRLEYTNNFMQRVADLLLDKPLDKQILLLRNSLFGTTVSGLEKAKIGQFDPGKAGGYNQGMGIETKDFIHNPWNYILAFEGVLLMASSISRRNPTNQATWMTSPFTVRFSPVGFTSSSYAENGRGEVWLPLWDRSASYSEIKQLFGEGRSVVGRRHVRTGLEFSRAVCTLGVDRGIKAFERYVFLQRRGQSYVALPAGRFNIRYESKIELLKELDPVLFKLDKFLRGFKNVPAHFLSARKQIDEAIFDCVTNSSAYQYKKIIRALGKIERLIAQRDRNKKPSMASPLWGLSPDWLAACDDGTVEIRIAASLASISSTDKVGTIRTYLSGVSANYPPRWKEGGNSICWIGNSFAERLARLLIRRIMDAEKFGVTRFPLDASMRISAYDVMPFLNGETDDNMIEDMLWGFTLIDWVIKKGKSRFLDMWKKSADNTMLSRTWCLLKLLHSPYPIREKSFRREPTIGNLLLAGRVDEACRVAITRLMIADLKPYNVMYEESKDHLRLLASLTIPVYNQRRLETLVLNDIKKTLRRQNGE